jgi:hypothetical protein
MSKILQKFLEIINKSSIRKYQISRRPRQDFALKRTKNIEKKIKTISDTAQISSY